MIKKTYSKTNRACRVTFKLPSDVEARTAHLIGDFNQWDKDSHPMKILKDRSFSITLSVKPGSNYRFRYLLDSTRWENDWEADGYVANDYGSEDSFVEV